MYMIVVLLVTKNKSNSCFSNISSEKKKHVFLFVVMLS